MDRDERSAFALLTAREWAVLRSSLEARSRRDVAPLFDSIPIVRGRVEAWGEGKGVLTSDEVAGEVLAWAEVIEGGEHLAPGDRVAFGYGPLPPSSTYPQQAIWVRTR